MPGGRTKPSKDRTSPEPNNDGVIMIISPAKSLNNDPENSSSIIALPTTNPSCDDEKTLVIAKAMKSRDEKSLSKLLGLSAKLGKTVHEHWSSFSFSNPPKSQLKPAIYMYSGPAYQGIDISTCSTTTLEYLQNNLRIIDALYGTLRPLDLIQPYRLEMATKNVFPDKKESLSAYWRDSITSSLSRDLDTSRKQQAKKIIVNVASEEYSTAVDMTLLPRGTIVVKIVFRQEGRVISVHAKRARGLFVRFVAENGVKDVEGLKGFDCEGYEFIEEEKSGGSCDDNDEDDDVREISLVFDRKKNWKEAGMKGEVKKKETNGKRKSKADEKKKIKRRRT